MKNFPILLLLLCLVLVSIACTIQIHSSTISTPKQISPAPETITPLNPDWKSPKPANTAPALPSIADVVEKTYPSVVTITTEQLVSDIFSRPMTQTGAGSGRILDKNGIIITNNHVVEGANKVASFNFQTARPMKPTRVMYSPIP